jgi:hypothetical protein
MNVRYTDDDKKLWEQMYSSGLSSYQISKQLNVPKPSVYKHIKSCGISRNWSEWQIGKEPWNKGITGAQVAWNKGLNKHNDERIKKYSEKIKGNNYQNPWSERYYDKDYLYLVTVWLDGKLVYKVGRSFNKLANHTKSKLNSIIQIWSGIHYQVHYLEKYIHEKYQEYKVNFGVGCPGYTECYNVDFPILEITNLVNKKLYSSSTNTNDFFHHTS